MSYCGFFMSRYFSSDFPLYPHMGRETGSFVRSHPRARPTQYDPRERPWYQLGAAAFNNMGQELFDAYFMLKEQSRNLENTVSQRTGALRSANIKLADKAADLEDAIEIARDANQVKSEFLANMSHEIRIPMNAIMGFTELLYMSEDDSDKKRKLEIIKTSGENLLVLINDILDFSKIEAGKVDLERISFNLEVTLDHLYSMYKRKTNDKGLYFNISIDKLVPKVVSGDKQSI